jgi:hypothetical protein
VNSGADPEDITGWPGNAVQKAAGRKITARMVKAAVPEFQPASATKEPVAARRLTKSRSAEQMK